MPSRNYQYGLRRPTTNADLVHEQMYNAHRYRNQLVEIELRRREATDAAMRELCPGLLETEQAIADCQLQVDAELARLQERRRQERSRKPRSPELTALRSTLRTLRRTRADIRATYFRRLETQHALQAITEQSNAAVRAARAACGCYWGTYLLVEQAADAFRKRAPPRFAGYRGNGRIGVQLQGGADWEDLLAGNDTRLQIEHTPQTEPRFAQDGTELPMPGPRRQAKQYTVRIRIGSDGRSPIWASFPLILHRHPPAGSQVKWAVVSRRIVAGQERWKLTLTLDVPTAAAQRPTATTGLAAIDVGYRLLPDGSLRVAYLQDTDGREDDLRIPAGKVGEWRKVDDIQSIRDQAHNEARAALREWMQAHTPPEWLREATTTMHAWRRLSRLSQLVRVWGDTRFEGDVEIFETLEAWRRRERHLWLYQENLRDQLIAWRKDWYRNIAADLRQRYRTLAIEKLDLRELHDVQRPQDEQEVRSTIRWAARTANLSRFRQCLLESGCAVLELDPANTTAQCHACHELCNWDQAAQIRHTCEHCGATWDQDQNAARNLLASGQAELDAGGSLEPGPSTGDSDAESAPRRLSRSERLQAARRNRSNTRQERQI